MILRMILFFLLVNLCGFNAFGTFIPEEELRGRVFNYSEDDANMTEEEFLGIIEKMETLYKPIIELHGGQLNIAPHWDNNDPNANANQFFNFWVVNMYGGLARHPEVTFDGFTLVICHELGHHLAGFPFVGGGFGGIWAANEGQSDYYATHFCGPDLWREDTEVNATFRDEVHPIVQERCDSVWSTEEEQNLCYRINAAGESLARTLADLKSSPEPSYETPDESIVSSTNNRHPDAQCRLDTYHMGSLCTATFLGKELIPGKKVSQGTSSLEAEIQAAENSCTIRSNFTEGLRPSCWFKERE